MANEKYTCPRCNSKMFWTGNISPDISEKRWLKILYHYKCVDPRCGYKSSYDELDAAGERIAHMMNNMDSILED